MQHAVVTAPATQWHSDPPGNRSWRYCSGVSIFNGRFGSKTLLLEGDLRLLAKHDLSTLGQYYRQYDRLMSHWRTVLPLALHDMQYECRVEISKRRRAD